MFPFSTFEKGTTQQKGVLGQKSSSERKGQAILGTKVVEECKSEIQFNNSRVSVLKHLWKDIGHLEE